MWCGLGCAFMREIIVKAEPIPTALCWGPNKPIKRWNIFCLFYFWLFWMLFPKWIWNEMWKSSTAILMSKKNAKTLMLLLFLFFVFIGITAEWFSSIYWLMCLYRWGQTQLERIAMARAIKLLQRIKYRWIHTMKRLQLSFPASALATFYSIH